MVCGDRLFEMLFEHYLTLSIVNLGIFFNQIYHYEPKSALLGGGKGKGFPLELRFPRFCSTCMQE